MGNVVQRLRLLTGGKLEQSVPKGVRKWQSLRDGVNCWESADAIGYTA